MNIFFVRHGQTDYNIQGRIQGGLDIPLNDKGIDQARELARICHRQDVSYDGIYSSPKRRAKQTAALIAQAFGTDYHILDGLQEINLGDWQGMTWDEVRNQYPADYKIWYQNRRYSNVYHGESYQDMVDRVLYALGKLAEKGYENVLVVTHSAVIMCLQCLVEETPFEKMTQYKPNNGQIVELNSLDLGF